ncbi:hypothetical protein OGAPHI_005032 [Ogataea philodendri]|uniref:Uncharacterized protein n=1 Tax=Ogataea philodendri TaxID=1378263 RepID=A0A9P8T2G3_9ASCO|nr:uncharacterized protein OGAPHI_005032 [Ogataea philodendri]KAH3663631.1 hypothetical protein OGAPHI_005032 [Ogataea philodendri]
MRVLLGIQFSVVNKVAGQAGLTAEDRKVWNVGLPRAREATIVLVDLQPTGTTDFQLSLVSTSICDKLFHCEHQVSFIFVQVEIMPGLNRTSGLDGN